VRERRRMAGKHTAPDWTELYRLELGVDPHDRQQLFTAVSKDMTAASHGDIAAKRRVSAYGRAQRAFDRKVAAEERQAAQWAKEAGEVIPVDPWAAEAEDEAEEAPDA
jgi:hypothetical protein